ncbi:MAG TPA: epoxide hydrolase N-terminal domain-containing protein, partial [Devosia sp.]|nr:epoxide hydrolase N-terminal domain-containing protein [Devosia sp.]
MSTITPFTIAIPDAQLADLKARLAATILPTTGGETGWAQGPALSYVERVLAYLAEGFDWRTAEAGINRHPQFITTIDGQPIHFLQVKSPEPSATPLLLIHGWPGSIVEFLDVIGPLTDPVAHGGKASDAFDLVIP